MDLKELNMESEIILRRKSSSYQEAGITQLPETVGSQCQEINTGNKWKFSISDQRKATILRVSFGFCLVVFLFCFVMLCSCFGFPVLMPKLQFYKFIFYDLCQVLQDKDNDLIVFPDCSSDIEVFG